MFDDLEKLDGAMSKYLQFLYNCLREETKKDNKNQQLKEFRLIKLLRENDWEIPTAMASFVCRKLGIEYDKCCYYRKIVVWLPDIQWKEDPPCPNC